MTCHDVLDFLMAYLDGELPSQERGVFEEHLAGCADCRFYLQNYQSTVRLMRAACDLEKDPTQAGVPEELVQAILAARMRND